MSQTYAQFSSKVLRLISDPDGSVYSEDLIHDAICAAHDAILPWVPNYGELEITAGSDGDLLPMPIEVYDVQAIQIVETGKFIQKATLAPGTVRGQTLADNDWIESPKGSISLSKPLLEGAVLRVFYLGYWSKPPLPSSSSFVIQVPTCAHQGMVFYAASLIVVPTVVDISTLGPFKQRIDSGTPESNPMKITSEWMRNLFLQEMKAMPPYQKVRT